tara:strand:- start:758 stop:1387 length:630 start_codon:yes stop_codon:yes gene_type:complete
MDITTKIKDELIKTVGNKQYNGWDNRTSFGYHSYNVGNVNIVGQRNPKIRIDDFRKHIDFTGKNVIDFGCNVGAMLHHLTEIKSGLGLDYDTYCITAATEISNILERDNLTYRVHDFDKDGYDILKGKIDVDPDIILLLSLGSWVTSWEELYKTALDTGATIILEINNEDEGKPQIEFFKGNGCDVKLIVDNSLDDSTGNNRRKTYLVS